MHSLSFTLLECRKKIKIRKYGEREEVKDNLEKEYIHASEIGKLQNKNSTLLPNGLRMEEFLCMKIQYHTHENIEILSYCF